MFTKTLLFLVLLLALFHPAERLFPARRTQRPWRRGSFHDLLHGVLNPLLINFGAALLLVGVSGPLALRGGGGGGSNLSLPLELAI